MAIPGYFKLVNRLQPKEVAHSTSHEAHSMPTASVPRNRIADGSLPSVCVVCGKDAPNRLFPGVSSPSLAWILLSPLVGLVTFWAYILLGGGASREKPAGLPFCDRHQKYWPRRAWFIILGFLAVIVPIVAGFTRQHARRREGLAIRRRGFHAT